MYICFIYDDMLCLYIYNSHSYLQTIASLSPIVHKHKYAKFNECQTARVPYGEENNRESERETDSERESESEKQCQYSHADVTLPAVAV